MKKHTIYIISILCCALAGSCAGADAPEGESGLSEVIPSASILVSSLTKAPLHGAVEGSTFPTNSSHIFALTAFHAFSEPAPGDDFTPSSRINADSAHTDSEGSCWFDKAKYYPETGNLYFYGFSPVANSSYIDGGVGTDPRVRWTLTGREDIMWAKDVTGIAKGDPQNQPAMLFIHKMQRIRMRFIKGETFPSGQAVSSVSIEDMPAWAEMDLITGQLEFGPYESRMSFPGGYGVGQATDAPIVDSFMLPAGVTSFVVKGVVNDAEFSADIDLCGEHGGEAGYSTILNLTFEAQNLTYTTSLSLWETVGTISGDI